MSDATVINSAWFAGVLSRQKLPGGQNSTSTSNVTTGSTTAGSDLSSTDDSDPIKAFEDYMKEPIEQRMEESWLAQHGITKDEFKSMDPAKKKALMDQMKQDIENQIRKKIGDSSGSTTVAASSIRICSRGFPRECSVKPLGKNINGITPY